MSWQGDLMVEQELSDNLNDGGEGYTRDLLEDVKEK